MHNTLSTILPDKGRGVPNHILQRGQVREELCFVLLVFERYRNILTNRGFSCPLVSVVGKIWCNNAVIYIGEKQ